MALMFQNHSRSYDETARRIRFVGHDGMAQISFAVEVDAFGDKAASAGGSEAQHLAAFDAARESVHDVARQAYSHGHKNIYVLTSSDFR